MNSAVKLLAAGAAFGIVCFFAFIGIKATLAPDTRASTSTANTSQQQSNPSSTSTTAENTSQSDVSLPSIDEDTTLTIAPGGDTASAQEAEAETTSTQQYELVEDKPSFLNQYTDNDSDESSRQQSPVAAQEAPSNTPNTAVQVAQATNTTPTPTPVPNATLKVAAIDAANQTAIPATFYIQKPSGENVDRLTSTHTGTFSLPAGTYKVTARYAEQKETQTVTLQAQANKTLNFKLGKVEPEVTTGKVQILLKDISSKAEVRGNIYVQEPSGRNVTHRNYTSSTEFTLDPGTYKITARAPNKVSLTKTITLERDKALRVTFELKTVETKPVTPAAEKPQEVTQNANEPKQQQNNNDINFDDIRTATLPGTSKPAPLPTAEPAQATTNNIMPDEVPQGTLQLYAIDGADGSPFPVTFGVRSLQGERLGRFRRVSEVSLDIPAQEVIVNIRYQGMRGRERINVTPGAPTIFTFTINRDERADMNQQQPLPQTQPPQALEEVLLQRLQQEVLNRLGN